MTTANTPNKLNELSAQEWLRFTKTWFVHNPPPRKKNEVLHPAKYPENMIAEFVAFFTKPGAVVFDPFLGTGSTLVACHNTNRNGIGIELQQKYADIARERISALEPQRKLQDGHKLLCKQVVLQANSLDVDKIWKDYALPPIDFMITSPPYGPMLNKKGLVSKGREEEGLDVNYSSDEQDLGNAPSYEEFLQQLQDIFVKIKPYLKEGAHLVVIIQNYMNKGEYKTLAWDVGKELSKHFQLRGERIWCQDNKTLYPYGYKYSFVPNVHHHYCLIFKKIMDKEE
ncbi:MAG TPA: DNA methyltransferase [Candidatus Nanoarchaeia archaeon]|nr:DNA methyltransferase [Candidatus Nanoarchaeia archaeon]